MATEILMPALSPTMEEGTLAKWLVKEGDTVSSGDIIAEIETDKATMEFEAVDEGVIDKILIAEGTKNVKVNTPIAIMVEDGETVTDAPASAPVAAAAPAAVAAAPAAAAAPAPLSRTMRWCKGACKSAGKGKTCKLGAISGACANASAVMPAWAAPVATNWVACPMLSPITF